MKHVSPPVSFKPELLCNGEWCSNATRFATAKEAEAAGREIMSRWFVPTDCRAVPTDDPVNYVFDTVLGRAVPIPQPQPTVP